MVEYEYNWLHCPSCDETHAFEARTGGAAPLYRRISCPVCGHGLGEIRADLGFQYIGEMSSQFSCTACLEGWPAEGP
jgi:C4-type Zn-finger protein